jgi:co-chaperonin GroES (HSP10)
MNIKPVRCVALIKPDKVDDKSSGGLYLPEHARDRMQFAVDRGEVIAVGDGFYKGMNGPIPEIGDKVIFDRYAGSLITNLNKDGKREDFRLVNDDSIVAIIEEEEDNG